MWWQHHLALKADGRTAEAAGALELAHRLLLSGVRGLSDAGLRRSYLNKLTEHRELLAAWVADARRRRLPRKRLTQHLAGVTDLREPFERLTDIGLRSTQDGVYQAVWLEVFGPMIVGGPGRNILLDDYHSTPEKLSQSSSYPAVLKQIDQGLRLICAW